MPDTAALIAAAHRVGGAAVPPPDDASLGALLRRQVAERPDDPYLIAYDAAASRREWTYRAFADAVGGVRAALVGRNVGAGDRVAVLLPNGADTVLTYFALWDLGAVVVPLSSAEPDERLGYILGHANATLVVTRAALIERLGEIQSERDDALPVLVTDELIDATAELPSEETERLESEALIVYTSGTTGPPKGVVLTQANLLQDARAIADWHRLAPGDRMMCVLPLHHVNGTVVTLVTPMGYGGAVVLNPKFSVEQFFPRLAAERVAVVSVVPTLLHFLVEANLDLSVLDLAAFRHIICGAGPLTVHTARRFEDRYGFPIIHGYGLSETTCYSCFLPVDLSADEHRKWMRDHGFPSIGVPLPVNEMAIHDEAGHALGAGERGEIVVRGANVMSGYYDQPEANRKTFAHGWFRSGDEGFYVLDDAGRPFFFITGRLKELIIRGGVNLAPLEIDEVIGRCPGVKVGVSVGFDNDAYGEEVGAYVEPLIDDTVTEAAVIAHCRAHLPWAKVPKIVLFGHDVPVTSTGKYQRGKLKPLFAEHRATQFREPK